MQTVIITNIFGTQQIISDLGKVLEIDEEITLSDYFSYEEIASSGSLRYLIQNNRVSVNNGIETLSIADALKYLTIDDLYTPDSDAVGDAFDNLILTNNGDFILTNSLSIVTQE